MESKKKIAVRIVLSVVIKIFVYIITFYLLSSNWDYSSILKICLYFSLVVFDVFLSFPWRKEIQQEHPVIGSIALFLLIPSVFFLIMNNKGTVHSIFFILFTGSLAILGISIFSRTFFLRVYLKIKRWVAKEFGPPSEAVWITISWGIFFYIVLHTIQVLLNSYFSFLVDISGYKSIRNQSLIDLSLSIAVLAKFIPIAWKFFKEKKTLKGITILVVPFLLSLFYTVIRLFPLVNLDENSGQLSLYLDWIWTFNLILILGLLAYSQKHSINVWSRFFSWVALAGTHLVYFWGYPILALALNNFVPGFSFSINPLILNTMLIGGLVIVLLVGPITVLLTRPSKWYYRGVVGTAAGALTGSVLFAGLVGTVVGISSHQPLFQYTDSVIQASYAERLFFLAEVVSDVFFQAPFIFWITILTGALVGGLSALIVFWAKPKKLSSPVNYSEFLPFLIVSAPLYLVVFVVNQVILILLSPSVQRIYLGLGMIPSDESKQFLYIMTIPNLVLWGVVSLTGLWFFSRWPDNSSEKRLAAVTAFFIALSGLIFLPLVYLVSRESLTNPLFISLDLIILGISIELFTCGLHLWKIPLVQKDKLIQKNDRAGFLASGAIGGWIAGFSFIPLIAATLGTVLISVVEIISLLNKYTLPSSAGKLSNEIDVLIQISPIYQILTTITLVLLGLYVGNAMKYWPWAWAVWVWKKEKILRKRLWNVGINLFLFIRQQNVRRFISLISIIGLLIFLAFQSPSLLFALGFLAAVLLRQKWIEKISLLGIALCFTVAGLGAAIFLQKETLSSFFNWPTALSGFSWMIVLLSFILCYRLLWLYTSGPHRQAIRIGIIVVFAVVFCLSGYYFKVSWVGLGNIRLFNPQSNSFTLPDNNLLKQAKNLRILTVDQGQTWFTGNLGSFFIQDENRTRLYQLNFDSTSSASTVNESVLSGMKRLFSDVPSHSIQDEDGRIWFSLSDNLGILQYDQSKDELVYRKPGKRGVDTQLDVVEKVCLANQFALFDPTTQAETDFLDQNINISSADPSISDAGTSGLLSAVFSAEDRYILTNSDQVKLWDIQGNQVAEFGYQNQPVKNSNISPDGEYFLTYYAAGVKIWHEDMLVQSFPLPALEGSQQQDEMQLRQAAFFNQGTQIIGFTNTAIWIWDRNSGNSNKFTILNEISDLDIQRIIENIKNDQWIDLADGKAQIIDSQGEIIALWENNRFEILHKTLPYLEGSSDQTLYSPDGNYLLHLNISQNMVELWKTSGEQIKVLAGLDTHEESFDNNQRFLMGFNPQSDQIFVYATLLNNISVWDVRGNHLYDWKPNLDQVSSVSYSNSGNNLVAAGCLQQNSYTVLTSQSPFTSLAFEGDRYLWAGTQENGIYRIDIQQPIENTDWLHITKNEGLPDNQILSLLSDQEEKIWIAALTGLAYWDGKSIQSVPIPGLSQGEYVNTLFEDSQGGLWVGGVGKIMYHDASGWVIYQGGSSWPADLTINQFVEDSQGSIWAASSNGVRRFKMGTWSNLIPNLYANRIVESDGQIWVATKQGVVRFTLDSNDQEIFDYLPETNWVRDLAVDKNGTIWISTFESKSSQRNPGLAAGLLGSYFIAVFGYVIYGYGHSPMSTARRFSRKILKRQTDVLVLLYEAIQHEEDALLLIQAVANEQKGLSTEWAKSFSHLVDPDKPLGGDLYLQFADQLAQIPDVSGSQEISNFYHVMVLADQARSIQTIANWPVRFVADQVGKSPLLIHEGSAPLALPVFFNEAISTCLFSLCQVAVQLNKYQRVTASSDRLGFLASALGAIENASNAGTQSGVPERRVLNNIITCWRDCIQSELTMISGQAQLELDLITRQIRYTKEITVAIRIRNVGEAIAENISVSLFPGDYFSLKDSGIIKLERLSSQTDCFLEFILHPVECRSIRLEFAVRWTDRQEENKLYEFAAPLLLYESQTDFKPIPNPYQAGKPLKSARLFQGREDIFRFLQDNFSSAVESHALVLYGQRRTGKTSILYQILNGRLGDRFIPVLVDMQEIAISIQKDSDFIVELTSRISESVKDAGIKMDSPDLSDLHALPIQTFNRFLDKLEAKLEERRVLLMLDEFEEIEGKIQQGKLSADLPGYIRSLVQHRDGLIFFFIGAHRLEEMSYDYWSILFNLTLYREVSFLNAEEAERLIRQPVDGLLDIDTLAVEKIFRLTHGQPYFIQLLCHELVNHCNALFQNYATINDINDVLERVLTAGNNHLAFIWQQAANMEQRLALASLAQLLKPGKDWVEPEEILNLLQSLNYREISYSVLITTLDLLVKSGTLIASKEGVLRYRYQIEILRMWIVKNEPVNLIIEHGKSLTDSQHFGTR